MKTKKAIALILTVLLSTATFAACGGNKDTGSAAVSSESSAATSSSTTESTASTTESTGEKTKVSFMGMAYVGSPLSSEKSKEIIKQVEEYTNVELDLTWVPNDSYEEKLGVTLMSKDNLPMILATPSLNATVVQAANAGAFWDLSPYIYDSTKYPNLSQSNKDVNSQMTVGGKLVGVYRARPIGRNGLGYRKDWADKLGLEEPKTVEDVYNMAKAFTENDPDGNGKKDTYGISLCKYEGPFDVMQTWFGVGNNWTEKDGKLVPVHQTEEYMEALKWFRKMYEEGLVYQDWAVRETNTWEDSLKNGECGIHVDVLDGSRRIWDYFENNNIPAVTGEGIASMNLVGAIAKDSSSSPHTLATSGMNGLYTITQAAKDEAQLEACLGFLDKMNDNEMMRLADFGLENDETGWKLNEEGFIESITKELLPEQRAHHGLNQLVPYIPNAFITDPPIQRTERQVLEEKVKADNIANAVFNPAAGYLVNSETYSVNGANLDQILKDARTQYICLQIDEAGLQAAFDNWANQGGTKVMEEVNALHSA